MLHNTALWGPMRLLRITLPPNVMVMTEAPTMTEAYPCPPQCTAEAAARSRRLSTAQRILCYHSANKQWFCCIRVCKFSSLFLRDVNTLMEPVGPTMHVRVPASVLLSRSRQRKIVLYLSKSYLLGCDTSEALDVETRYYEQRREPCGDANRASYHLSLINHLSHRASAIFQSANDKGFVT